MKNEGYIVVDGYLSEPGDEEYGFDEPKVVYHRGKSFPAIGIVTILAFLIVLADECVHLFLK